MRGWRLVDFVVAPNGNFLVTGQVITEDTANYFGKIFIASYTPFGKLRWSKEIKQSYALFYSYQEMDKWNNLNITSGLFNSNDTKNLVIDTSGNLRKVVNFNVILDNFGSGQLPKAKKLANGGYAFFGGDTIGILTDSNGMETLRIIRNYKPVSYWQTVTGFHGVSDNVLNELWPLQEGGVLRIIPWFLHSGGGSSAVGDSLAKIDENTGKVLWKVFFE
jgi:hypothetical protein